MNTQNLEKLMAETDFKIEKKVKYLGVASNNQNYMFFRKKRCHKSKCPY